MTAVAQAQEAQAAGWQASLALSFEAADKRTVMRRQHSGPLLVQRALYPEDDTCHAVLVHPPSGIVGGDTLRVDINSYEGSSALVTTPGATRFYRSDGRVARQSVNIDVSGGALEWLPMETIYFNHSMASQTITVKLSRDSRYIGWELSCFGRTAGNFPFTSGHVSSRLALDLDGAPLLHERLKVDGSADIKRISGLRGATVSGTMLAYAPDLNVQHCLEQARDLFPAEEFACTGIDGLLSVRYLGDSSERARNGFINAWKFIRPLVVQRPPCVPRIWST